MTDQHAYSTDQPDIVAAYRRAVADRDAMGKRIAADLRALGAGPRVTVYDSGFPGSQQEITAIEQAGDHIPDGWQAVDGDLRPRHDAAGKPARQWLAEHQPVDVRRVMEDHGLPRSAFVPGDTALGWRILTPALFEHDGVLWACYEGEPGTGGAGFDTEKCTWTPRPLSEYHAAWEAFQDADTAKAAADGQAGPA